MNFVHCFTSCIKIDLSYFSFVFPGVRISTKMPSKTAIPSLVILLLFAELGQAVNIDKDTENYIKELTDKYEKDPHSHFFSNVVQPPSLGYRDGDGNAGSLSNSATVHFLPKILIWCPLSKNSVELSCPDHPTEALKISYWHGSVKEWRQPRLLYDIFGNCLLVGRSYICPRACRFLSYDQRIISQIADSIPVPFLLLHRCGFLKDVIEYCNIQVGQGLTFSEISRGMTELNLVDYCNRYSRYMAMCVSTDLCESDSYRFSSPHLVDKDSDYIRAPSHDLLSTCFLYDFKQKRRFYEVAMEQLTASILCVDHTFKISRNIGMSRGNAWVNQYNSLFVGLNENGEVITWRFTPSEKFAEIDDLLCDLRDRLQRQGKALTCAYLDICCRWKSKMESVFGPGLNIKLDVFHAVKRVTSAIPKINNKCRQDMINDFSLVFRCKDDLDRQRKAPTPSPEEIELNIKQFLLRWDREIHSSIFNDKVRDEIRNLREHIRKGCLSGIPPGHGTERNEGLHKLLNSSVLSSINTIGVELAFAILTVVFYRYNSKILHKKDFPLPILAHALSLPSNTVSTENLGYVPFGFVGPRKRVECMKKTINKSRDDNLEMLTNDMASNLLYEMLTRHSVLSHVNAQCKARNIDVFNMESLFDANLVSFLGGRFGSDMDCDRKDHNVRLQRTVASFGLEIFPVDPDGDCAFTAVWRQIRMLTTDDDMVNDTADLTNHLVTLGLTLTDTTVPVKMLRSLFVDEICGEKVNYYHSFIQGMTKWEFIEEAKKFIYPGQFSGQVGDLIVMALSNLLKCPILVLTSMESCNIIPFIPENLSCNVPIFVAFNQHGPGHYDSTRPYNASPNIDNESEDVHEADREDMKPCRCGKSGNNGKSGDNGKKSCNSGGKYSSRCKCFKFKKPCTGCKCVNCDNPYNGVPPVSNNNKVTSTVKQSRKRIKLDVSRKKTSAFMSDMGEPIRQGHWNTYETSLVQCIIALPTVDKNDAKKVCEIYNFVVNLSCIRIMALDLREKSDKQVRGKLEHLSKMEKNCLSHVVTQLKVASERL